MKPKDDSTDKHTNANAAHGSTRQAGKHNIDHNRTNTYDIIREQGSGTRRPNTDPSTT